MTFADDIDCVIDEKDLKVVHERIKTKECTAELVVEEKRYADLGVHKGMTGAFCESEKVNGVWLVNFDTDGTAPERACVEVRDEDLRIKHNGKVLMEVSRFNFEG